MIRRCRLVVVLVATVAGTLGSAPPAHATTDTPVVTGPVGGAGLWGHALWDSWYDVGDRGYTQDEYFVSGTARSDSSSRSAPYTTRIIVSRPISAERFNGTVVLDWANVTAQFEVAVDSVSAEEHLIRDGYSFVHVSAQAAGVCCTPLTPKIWDPVRYAALSHPGDEHALAMFSQIAKVIRDPGGVDPLGGLEVERVLAAGQSQSASRLYAYVTREQRSAGVIDGFLIHGGGSKSYAEPPAVPVLHLLSDAEASPAPPNTLTNYRLWEMAGAAHSDFWIGYHEVFGQGPRALIHAAQRPATADDVMHETAGNYGEQPHVLHNACIVAGGAYPTRYVVSAAIDGLNRWVATGEPPPNSPRFAFDAQGELARDAFGNALGGLRLPVVDVPVASYVSTLCALGGITIPFTRSQLRAQYPTHADYYEKMVVATERSVADNFLLADDAGDLLDRACLAGTRWPRHSPAAGCSP